MRRRIEGRGGVSLNCVLQTLDKEGGNALFVNKINDRIRQVESDKTRIVYLYIYSDNSSSIVNDC